MPPSPLTNSRIQKNYQNKPKFDVYPRNNLPNNLPNTMKD